MKKNKFKETAKTLIPDLLFFTVMVTIIVYALLTFLELEPSVPEIYLLVAIVTLISFAAFSNLYGFLTFMTILVVYVVGVALNYFYSSRKFFDWFITTFMYGTVDQFKQYAGEMLLFSVISFTIMYYLFVIKLRFFTAYSLFTVGLFTYWSMAEYRIDARKVIIYSFFLVLLIIIYFYSANRYRLISVNNDFAQNKISYAKWNKYIFPIISIVLAITIIIMPANINHNLKNEKIFDLLESLRLNIESIFSGTKIGMMQKFNLAFVGFSQDQSKLGGPVRLSINHVFDVKGQGQIYLRGAVFDNYTGSGWTSNISENGYSFESSSDEKFVEFFHINKVKEWVPSGLFKLDNIVIDNIDISTSSVFMPVNPINIATDENDIYYNERTEFYSSKYIKGRKYEIEYYKENTSSLNYNLLRNDNFDFIKAISGYYPNSGELKELNAIRNKYLKLPDTVPESVHKLARDLAENADYQIDKVLSIQAYLRKNYKYVLDPVIVPDDVDFTKHFLFDTKEGYCTYYATAMIVLCRSLGIPARYVTGFRIDNSSGSKFKSVYNYNAHAWAEVFFPNIGWLTFDPVSPQDFRNNEIVARNPMASRNNSESSTPETPTLSPTPTPTPTMETNNDKISESPVSESEVPVVTGDIIAPPKNINNNTSGLIIIIITLCIILTGSIALIFIIVRRKRKRIRPLSYKEIIADKFNRIAAALSTMDCPLEAGETISVYFRKAEKAIEQFETIIPPANSGEGYVNADPQKVALLIESAIYSEYKLTDDEMTYLDWFINYLKHCSQIFMDRMRIDKKNNY